MVLQSTGTISLSNIQAEFGGTNPIGLNEYYSGGPYVNAITTGVPALGQISLNHFYGKGAVMSLFDGLSASAQADVVAIYGFKLYKSAYSGPVANLRRQDGVIADFYSTTTGSLQTSTGTSLTSWLGAATGFVDIWYDQSGRSKHLRSVNNNSSPTIVTSGTYGGRTAVYFTSSRQLSGPNVFDTSTVSNMHLFMMLNDVTRVDNYLLSFNGNVTDAATRFSLHAPWSHGVWFFDPGDINATAGNNRVSSDANVTTAGAANRTIFNGYKSSTENRNSIRLNKGTSYYSGGFTAAPVTGGVLFNNIVTGQPSNHYVYSMLVFKSKLGLTDSTYIEDNI